MHVYPSVQNLAIISDTHGLLRPELLSALVGTELILHAGDIGDRPLLRRLVEIAPVVAIRGNVDSLLPSLPLTELVEVNGKLIYLVHSIHDLDLNPVTASIHIVVTGHSHQPRIERKSGVWYINPGSPGPRRFKLPVTFVRAEWKGQDFKFELVELLR
jgi:uncharacterized protein